MKICLLTHTYPCFPNDTTAPFVESTAETLQKHGIDVTVLTPDTPEFARTTADHTVNLQTYRYFFPRRFQLLGYSNTLVNDCELKRYVYLLAPFMCLSAIFHLFRLHRKHHFDVIHAQWLLPNGFIGAVLCKVYELPLVITMQGTPRSSKEKFTLEYLWRRIFPTVPRSLLALQPTVLSYLCVSDIQFVSHSRKFPTPDTPIKTALRQNLTNLLFYAILLKI